MEGQPIRPPSDPPPDESAAPERTAAGSRGCAPPAGSGEPAPPALDTVRRVTLRRLAALGLLGLCVSLAVAFYGQHGFDLHPAALRDRIHAFGWLAPAAFVALCALRIFLMLPSWVLMSAGGLLFGVAGGVLWGSLGFTSGGLLSFAIARGLGRDAISARLRGRAARFDAYVSQRGAPWIALYTAIPVTPLTPVHASAGVSGMPVGHFSAGLVAGVVPRAALLSFFGDALAQGDLRRTLLALALIALSGAVGMLVVRRWQRGRSGAPPSGAAADRAASDRAHRDPAASGRAGRAAR